MQKNESELAYLNRAYFISLRTAAMASIPDACASFGVDAKFVSYVRNMSLEDIDKVALDKLMVFKPAIPTDQFIRMSQLRDSESRHILTRLVTPAQ